MSHLPHSSGFANNTKSTYQQGHTSAALASHTARTIHTSATFLLPHLQAHFKILDLGCGPGTITSGFCSFVPQGSVIGVDSSSTVIEKARALHPSSKFPNLEFQTADIFDGLPFPDESFDVVYTHQFLGHLPDLVTAIREIRRVLKTGGFLAARESDVFLWDPLLPGLEVFVEMVGKMFAFEGATPMPLGRHLRRYAAEAGFERGKMRAGMGQDCYADEDRRRWWADMWLGRLEEGGEYVGMLKRAGVSGEEFEIIRRDLVRWREDQDGWFTLMQGELLAWK